MAAKDIFNGFPHLSKDIARREIEQNPRDAYIELRKKFELFSNPEDIDPENAQRGLKFIDEISQEAHKAQVFLHDSKFEANWQLSRLLHRLGRHKEALTYIEMAGTQDPQNAKVAAREAEILLDLYNETPSLQLKMAALITAHIANVLDEDSLYTQDLLEKIKKTTTQEEIENYFDAPDSPLAEVFLTPQPLF